MRKKVIKEIKNLWRDESAQGATEYILLLGVVVALIVLFRGKITELIGSAINKVAGDIGQAMGN
jgi:Flp pilus assembly pilin Flp